MLTKSEKTSQFIIQVVAPIFNKNGYAATSMSDLTKATGLTKGAIYGNFKNKEELALAAFNFSIKYIIKGIEKHVEITDSPLERLYLLIDFYRSYYDFTLAYGGCPILNVGIDSNHQQTPLYLRTKGIIIKLNKRLMELIDAGKKMHEIKPSISSEKYATLIFSMIEGAIFMSFTMQNKKYLIDVMAYIDTLITNEIKL